jgi:hypothetical protein
MIFWSIVMIFALGIWRLRHWGHVLVVTGITGLVLILSQSLFIQLSLSAGVDPGLVFISPMDFLLSGPLAWLALLVMPCGWLGPFFGFNLVQRWYSNFDEI